MNEPLKNTVRRIGSSINELPARELARLTTDGRTAEVKHESSDSDSEDDQLFRIDVANINEEGSSIFSSVLNLANTAMGSGILGLPFAVTQSGYILSIIFFLFFSGMTSVALNLAMSAARTMSPNSSYDTMSKASISKINKLVDFAVALKSFLVATSYLIVIGDNIPPVVHEFLSSEMLRENEWVMDRRFWISIFVAVLIFPVVWLKRMSALAATSFLAIICFVYITIIVILFASNAMHLEGRGVAVVVDPFPTDWSFLKVIPIFVFAFTCQQNAYSITNELKNNTQNRLNAVIAGTVGLCTALYALVAYCGYATFGAMVKGDVLLNYPEVVPVAVVRIALSIAIAWSYPLQLHPTRRSIFSLFWQKKDVEMADEWFYGITYGITLCSFAISMGVDSLGFALEIIGSVCSPVIAFILPGFFYFYLRDQGLLREEEGKDAVYKIKRMLAMFLIVFGCLVIVFGLTVQFIFL